MKKRKWLSLLLAVMMLVSAVPFFPVTADAADGTVEVSTWAELKKALDYTTNCSVVKVVKDIETKSLNGHTGLHQDNIIFMSMAMDKVLDLNGHTVNAYAKYYSEVAQGYLINISHKDARLTIRDSVGGGALIGEFNQEFYYEFINNDIPGATFDDALSMYSDLNIAENYLEVPYDASAQAYVIDLVPEPDVIHYDYLSLGVPLPWAGERPIYNNNLVTGLPGGVSVVNYTWYASATGERIQADMTFIAGRRYHVNVILQCEEGYYIADDEELDAYVNGAKAYISAQDGDRTTLTVGYSVPVASGVHGQVVSFCDGSDVTVSLFADGSAESKYTVSVPGGTKDSSGQYTTTYDIPEVAPGTYTMQVSKKNHVTREYTVTVSGDAVTQDAKIHLMGDINGDGRISIGDINKANLHAKGKKILLGYELACADINGDGRVTTSDVNKMNLHNKGKSLLW